MIVVVTLPPQPNSGVGLFEANAIQFGLDQLLEAPTPKLIAFIHWYYWTHNVVQLVAMYITVGWKGMAKKMEPRELLSAWLF